MKKALLLSIFVSLSYLLNAQTLEIVGNGNLRSGPGTTNNVIGKVTIGTKVTQIEFSNDWYKVELPNKSSGWIYKTLVKIDKQGKTRVQQKPDTIQLTANVIAEAIRDVILGYYKNNLMMASGILITQEYPLKVNLSLDKQGSLKIVGKNDTILITQVSQLDELHMINCNIC